MTSDKFDKYGLAYATLRELARSISDIGIVSASGHGNISVRPAGADEFLYSIAPSLSAIHDDEIVRVAADGRVVAGHASPYAAGMIPIHTAIYRVRPDTTCTIHTHSPHATAFAIARKPIACYTEAFRLYGLSDGVPVTRYVPRESADAAAAVKDAIGGRRTQAVLIANHGVICFHASTDLAMLVSIIVEEAAQLALLAHAIGGPETLSGGLES
jgi:ribulose-5-phosphate 4-epimerase/fuculose-1-phosphate aldolase